MNYKKLGDELLEWMDEPKNFLVREFFILRGITEQDVMVIDDPHFKRCHDLALQTEEVKVVKGSLDGDLDRSIALKFLEEFHGWKKEDKSSKSITVIENWIGNDGALELKKRVMEMKPIVDIEETRTLAKPKQKRKKV